jgi:AcrR family transcriptional regulator
MEGEIMASNRRMGPQTAATRTALMDATEAVMREEGYAAVTSRRVAERAGLNQQTVYYYFETMDDLLLAAFRRRSEQMVERTREALESDRPLHMLWQLSSDPYEGALTVEYLALANHNEAIRREAIELTGRMRVLKDHAVAERLEAASPDPEAVTPLGLITALGYVAHLLAFEGALGIRSGHKEVRMVTEWALRQFEANGVRPKPAREPQRRAG